MRDFGYTVSFALKSNQGKKKEIGPDDKCWWRYFAQRYAVDSQTEIERLVDRSFLAFKSLIENMGTTIVAGVSSKEFELALEGELVQQYSLLVSLFTRIIGEQDDIFIPELIGFSHVDNLVSQLSSWVQKLPEFTVSDKTLALLGISNENAAYCRVQSLAGLASLLDSIAIQLGELKNDQSVSGSTSSRRSTSEEVDEEATHATQREERLNKRTAAREEWDEEELEDEGDPISHRGKKLKSVEITRTSRSSATTVSKARSSKTRISDDDETEMVVGTGRRTRRRR